MSNKNIYTPFIHDQFCVYHTVYSGTLLPPNYIGSSSVYKVLNENYHGSVKSKKYKTIWESELKEHPELFQTTIISYHDTRLDALWKELQIQKIFNIVKNELFINMSYSEPNGFFGRDVSGENNPSFGNKKAAQKGKDTYFEKTGFYNPQQNPEVKQKTAETNLKNTGYSNPLANPELWEKGKITSNEKYGFDYAIQNPEIRQKAKDTNFKNTGYENPFSDPELMKRVEDEREARTGYRNPMHDPNIVEQIRDIASSHWICINPTGEVFKTNRFKDFCDDRGLSYINACRCAKRNHITSKGKNAGWSFQKDPDFN